VVAHACGVHPSYLCDVERGRRPISRRLATDLETVLQTRPGAFTRGIPFPARGRKRLEPLTRQALRELGIAVEMEMHRARPRVVEERPRHPFPARYDGPQNLLWPIGLHLGPEAQREVESLEQERKHDEFFWRTLNAHSFDSWTEKRCLVRIALLGGQFVTVSPKRIGCRLNPVCGRTGRNLVHRALPALVFRVDGISVAVFPQRTVRTVRTHRRPDLLLVAACNSQRKTFILETDSPEFHQDGFREDQRDAELDADVLHVPPDVVGHPRFLDAFKGWIRRQFN
jgi:hypothetical protein